MISELWGQSISGNVKELEPELIQGKKTKWLSANDFMYIDTL